MLAWYCRYAPYTRVDYGKFLRRLSGFGERLEDAARALPARAAYRIVCYEGGASERLVAAVIETLGDKGKAA